MKVPYEKVKVIIDKNEIYFSNGYFFAQSPVNRLKRINSTKISEINLNTSPPSLVYNENEIIFLKEELRAEIEPFAIKTSIPMVNRLDIWSHINLPYLDTELDDNQKLESTELLLKNGISNKELLEIRKKVKKTMFLNFFAWEWEYLGLFDYLGWTFLTEKKYWWAMEIGLRNFKGNSPMLGIST